MLWVIVGAKEVGVLLGCPHSVGLIEQANRPRCCARNKRGKAKKRC
jgi:hypothetical protein